MAFYLCKNQNKNSLKHFNAELKNQNKNVKKFFFKK